MTTTERRLTEPWSLGVCSRGHDITNPANVRAISRNGHTNRSCRLCDRIRNRTAPRCPAPVVDPNATVHCRTCEQPIVKNDKEGITRYLRRRYCSPTCRHQAKHERRVRASTASASTVLVGEDWAKHGACRTADPELFFHPEGEMGVARTQRDDAAKAVCRRCPVLADCRRHALGAPESWGVWGGLTEHERAELAKGATS